VRTCTDESSNVGADVGADGTNECTNISESNDDPNPFAYACTGPDNASYVHSLKDSHHEDSV
jgi:hypothetical protein